MNNIHIMQIVESKTDFVDSACCVCLCKFLLLLEQAIEFSLLHIFHQQIDVFVIGEESIEFY